MVPSEISAAVLRFIDECIDSVPQLEALLMMNDDPQRTWTVAAIAARTYVPLAESARVLEALHRHALVSPAESGEGFRFAVGDRQRADLIGEVARTYRANLARIATIIHEKPPASLKEFARAFDMTKDR
jgi:hypothetical protein